MLSCHGVSQEAESTDVPAVPGSVIPARPAEAAVCTTVTDARQRLPRQVDDDLALGIAGLVVPVEAPARVPTRGALFLFYVGFHSARPI